MLLFRKLRFVSLLLLLNILVVAGCGSKDPKPGDTVEREGEPPVTYFDDDDPKMLAAIEKARSTAGRFIQSLNNPTPAQSSFSVKIPVKDGKDVEHMWLDAVRYENGKFSGNINNDPITVKTVRIGDEISIAKDQISDWMFVDGGKLVGGYTMRVMRDQMSEEERNDLDRSVPFTFD